MTLNTKSLIKVAFFPNMKIDGVVYILIYCNNK